MIGIYFSATGNTTHCVEKLVHLVDKKVPVISMEQPDVMEQIREHETIVFGYPIQFSNLPLMVHDFIKENHTRWKGKQIICLNTMGLFSGDGTGCAARLLQKYGATICGGLQIRMPNSVCDVKTLKKSDAINQQIVQKADEKIEEAASMILKGYYPREGLDFMAHMAGLFGQRLWFYHKTRHYTSALKISDACRKCGLCVSSCPMHNLTLQNGKIVQKGKCTMCYRCLNHCPQKAITLLGKKVVQQYHME